MLDLTSPYGELALETFHRMRWATYPGVVELGLDANHVTLLLVLDSEDVELSGAERPNGRVSKGLHDGKMQ